MNEHPLALTASELRVLGALLEKEMATPEYYPLTLNALVNACNQKTNREPVVSYDEETAVWAVSALKDKRLVRQSNIGRAIKYEQIFSEGLKLTPREKAIICILILRGPQTIGEIRGRTERLYSFNELDEVRTTIDNLSEASLVARLPVQPGQKEARYAHLLGERVQELATTEQSENQSTHSGQLADMQNTIELLKTELAELRREFEQFKAQFDS